jgi:hypothetical protein
MLTRRITLRLRVMAGAVAITLIALTAFDFAAVSTMRGYLVRSTSADLQQALITTAPQLDVLLPAALSKTAKGHPAFVRAVVGEYSVVYRQLNGRGVVLQYGAGLSATALAAGQIARVQVPVTAVTYNTTLPRALVAARRAPGGELLAGTSLDQVNQTMGRIVLILVAAPWPAPDRGDGRAG